MKAALGRMELLVQGDDGGWFVDYSGAPLIASMIMGPPRAVRWTSAVSVADQRVSR